jgi:hypothetical protein
VSARVHAWRPTPPNHPACGQHARSARLGARLAPAPSLPPDAVDLRFLVPEVLDQGATSTCAAHAVAQAIRCRAQCAWPGILPPPLPSRRALYRDALGYAEHERGEPVVDEGTTFGDLFAGAAIAGVVPESVWPWDEAHPIADLPPEVERIGADHRWQIDGYLRLDDADRRGAISRAIAAGHPVVIGATIDEAFEAEAGAELVTSFGDAIGGHAMAVVGYDAEGVWLVNSWGPSWRAGGFARLAWALVESDRVGEAWAISVAPPGWLS